MPTEEPTLQHIALHLAKYAGELAAVAEHLDHADIEKRLKGQSKARRFILSKRIGAILWCLEEATPLLQRAGWPKDRPTVQAALSAPPEGEEAGVAGGGLL